MRWKLKLAQLELEEGQEAYRIAVQDKAAVPKSSRELTTGSKYMAVTPVVVLFLIFGLVLVQEIVCRGPIASEETSGRSPAGTLHPGCADARHGQGRWKLPRQGRMGPRGSS